MIIHLLWDFIVEYILFTVGRAFIRAVTLGRFPSPEQADKYESLIKLVGLFFWIGIVLGISLWK